jgi:hypothetical protein
MRRKKATRSGRISLYVSPELHDDLARLAGELGLDLNGLIGVMIRRSFHHFEMEARLLATLAEEEMNALVKWRRDNPKRPIREFLDDYVRHQRGQWLKDQVQFWHDVRFTLDEAYAATLDPFATP